MEPFGYNELSLEEKIYIGSLSKHPGFVVLKKLMDSACDQATKLVIKLDPEDPAYDTKLKARQLVARVTNDVCATMLKSIVMHTNAGAVEEQAEELKKALEASGAEAPELGLGMGSIRIKSREGKS